ncbi:MAG: Transcriptional regulatory protein ZraR [Syntrophorhabdaceae bacterium PtaU1.Bin034]|jgi:PAS domain S-box-containing protein|nr:MAG: Transcriptional regulatory protein ZraR [Syntrophorhabdaceae bacterium PtaU1.Bin034]
MDDANDREIILDSINEGVFTVDMAWRITSFNTAAERITGVPREDAIGRRCIDVFHANICETACALRRTMADGRPVVNTVAHIVSHEGQRVPIRISTALLKNDEGRVKGGVETFQDLSQVEELKRELRAHYSFQDIIGRSPAMTRLFDILPRIAESTSTVLIEGASGTGKELFARAVHNLSNRKQKRFVAVNCGALPDTLLESELFGYKAGAFTDARRDKTGRFALAEGGTIFLDEIGDISPAMQVRLLRVLQERTYEPLGGMEPVKANVRIVAATNRNLADLVKVGAFREDLYYRIRVVHLRLPSLKERREDIPLLVDHLVMKFNRLQEKDVAGVSEGVMARLMEHDFPGNVRELENIIEQAFVLCRGGLIEMNHLPPELRASGFLGTTDRVSMTIALMEKQLITLTLERNKGNRRKTASDLGIDTSTLFRKIRSFGLEIPSSDGRRR